MTTTELSKKDEAALNLNPQQLDFANNYVKGMGQTRAYMKAFKTTYQNAAPNAHELLKNPKIKEYIAECFKEKSASTGELIEILSNVSRGDLGDFYDEDGRILSLDVLQEKGISRLIKKIKQRVYVNRAGQEIVETEIEIEDKQSAIDKLLKVQGAYLERVDINVRHYVVEIDDDDDFEEGVVEELESGDDDDE